MQVKLISNSTNRISSLVAANSMVISMSICNDLVAAGYLNGSVFISSINQRENSNNNSIHLLNHTCSPFGLALTSTGYLCAAGSDGKVVFARSNGHSNSGEDRQFVEIGNQISGLVAFPSGNTLAVLTLNSIVIFTLSSHSWRKFQTIQLDDAHLITSLTVSKDGSDFLAATISGAIEMFTCEWKKTLLSDRFEINYVGENQLIVKDIQTLNSSTINLSGEIKDVKIVRSRFAILWTTKTLIIVDLLDSNKTSQVDWPHHSSNKAKFCFDYEGVVIINSLGELFIIELGTNGILASVRTEFVSPHLLR